MEGGLRNRTAALAAAAILLCLVLLTAACNREQRRTIAVIPKGTSHLFWVSVQAGALAAGQDLNVNVEWNGAAQETEYDRQIQILDSMIARHVDGIAVAAAERKALVQSIDRAASLNIPVVVFDSGVDTENYVSFLATNNYEGGQNAARELTKLLHGKGTAAMVMHAPGSASTMDRERGFDDAMKNEAPGIQIVARQFGMSDRSKAMSAAENIFTAHPDLGGVFASSEPSSVGTALAIKSRGLAGKVKYVGFDSSDDLIQDLRAGVIDALVVQDPFKMGYEAVRLVVDKLNGKTPPKRVNLSARVIHKEDLDKPDVKQLLQPDVKKYLKQ